MEALQARRGFKGKLSGSIRWALPESLLSHQRDIPIIQLFKPRVTCLMGRPTLCNCPTFPSVFAPPVKTPKPFSQSPLSQQSLLILLAASSVVNLYISEQNIYTIMP